MSQKIIDFEKKGFSIFKFEKFSPKHGASLDTLSRSTRERGPFSDFRPRTLGDFLERTCPFKTGQTLFNIILLHPRLFAPFVVSIFLLSINFLGESWTIKSNQIPGRGPKFGKGRLSIMLLWRQGV